MSWLTRQSQYLSVVVSGRALSLASLVVLAGLSVGFGVWSATTSPNVGAEIPPATGADVQPIVIGMRPFTSTGRLSDYLEFPRHIVSGPLMRVTLVVNNPGGTVNLMQTCNPTLLVTLVKTIPRGPQPEPMACFGGQYILRHGVTRISAIVITTDDGCVDSSNVPTTLPTCVNGEIPLLPPGRYLAVASWNWPVVYLPAAQPVTVDVTDK